MVSIDSLTPPADSSPGQRGLPPSPGRPSAPAAASDDFADAATQMVDLSSVGIEPAHIEERTMPSRDVLPLPGEQPGAGGAQFVPDAQLAGHQGQTAFIHVDSLAFEQPDQQDLSISRILNDPQLRQGYQFGEQSIQLGEVNLIFAQNPMGAQVVLRQVWAEDAASMPPELRERLKQLESLRVPHLIGLNGIIASDSGVWAELPKPDGYRLSAVLSQHGAQPKENVVAWLKDIAQALDAIHAAELVYANLTPDALWIQPDNTVLLEPFDLLSFEKRGDLGAFGPIELKRPEDDRVLSPATDVFSLAAVASAALTGLPFDRENLLQLRDSRTVKRLEQAMSRNPAERPQSASEFAARFRVKRSRKSAGKFSFHPADLDIKVLAAVAVLLLGGFAAYMYWNQQQAEKEAARQHQQMLAAQAAEEEAALVDEESDEAAGSDEEDGDDEESAELAEQADTPPAEQPSSEDPRVTVLSSFENNPPSDEEAANLSSDEIDEESARLLSKAREQIKTAGQLASSDDKLDEYTRALENITSSIRLHRGKPTEEEEELLAKIVNNNQLKAYREGIRKRINDAIEDDNIGSAVNSYRRLWAIDYRADAVSFFNRNPRASVRTLEAQQPEADEEEAEQEDED